MLLLHLLVGPAVCRVFLPCGGVCEKNERKNWEVFAVLLLDDDDCVNEVKRFVAVCDWKPFRP